MSSISLALLIFGLCYLVIITERIHKTIVALLGAAVMIGLGVVSQDEAFYSHEFGVDYNVVFLLIGMMVIINIVRETGLFEVLAIWAAQRADAKPFRLLVLLALLTAGLSAMLDNVTTVLLMAPVTLAITKRLELNPVVFLVTEALASNIGGTATLVGDPPNIMIASKAELSYLDFLLVLGPIAVVIMARVRGGAVADLWAKNDRGPASPNGGLGIEFTGGRFRSTVLAPLSLAARDRQRRLLCAFPHSSRAGHDCTPWREHVHADRSCEAEVGEIQWSCRLSPMSNGKPSSFLSGCLYWSVD